MAGLNEMPRNYFHRLHTTGRFKDAAFLSIEQAAPTLGFSQGNIAQKVRCIVVMSRCKRGSAYGHARSGGAARLGRLLPLRVEEYERADHSIDKRLKRDASELSTSLQGLPIHLRRLRNRQYYGIRSRPWSRLHREERDPDVLPNSTVVDL